MGCSYNILFRPARLGGGWHLRLLENGMEVGGGVFPPVEGFENSELAIQAAYDEAQGEALDWLRTQLERFQNINKSHPTIERPIYYCNPEFPDQYVRAWPDGRRELVDLDSNGNIIVIQEMDADDY